MNKKLTQLKAKLRAAQSELAIRTRTNNSASRAYNKVTAKIADLEKKIADMAKISEWITELHRSRFIGFVARGAQPTQACVYAGANTPALQHLAGCAWTCRAFENWKKAVTSFQAWEQQNLSKFAEEANRKVLEQEEEIKALRDDLRVALDAYRQLLTKETKWT